MFPDVRKRCTPRSAGADSSRAPPPRALPRPPSRRPKRRKEGKSRAAGTKAPEGQSYFKGVVDLTHTMSPDFPTFFGVPGIELQKQYDFKKDGFNLNWWRILEHAGTHLDAPIHFSENGATADTIGAGELVVPLAVIDVRKQAEKDADYLMGIEDVLAWEKRFKKLPKSCCVAMLSGWAARVGDAAKYTGKDAAGTFHFPGIAPELAEWLLKERSVLGLAVDTLSLDNGPSKDFKTHHIWLPAGRWGLENVANLEKLSPSETILVVGLPKVKGSTGGPVRLIALDLICYPPGCAHARARGKGERTMGGNTQKYLAEVFGTAVLVLVGCASIVAEGFGAAAPIGFIGIGMTFGMTVTAMAFAIGPVSGCHLNPSVTAAVWASGRMSTNDAIGYIVSQIDRRHHRRADPLHHHEGQERGLRRRQGRPRPERLVELQHGLGDHRRVRRHVDLHAR